MDTTTVEPQDRTKPEPLSRPFEDRMLAGVAVGIARYLNVDVTVVRIIFAVLVVVGGSSPKRARASPSPASSSSP
jgi:phage shock protein C